MTDLPDKLDKILREAIVGENFVSYSDLGQAKADKAKAQINQLRLQDRLAELDEVYGDGSLHHYRVVEFINKRRVKYREQLALKTRKEQ